MIRNSANELLYWFAVKLSVNSILPEIKEPLQNGKVNFQNENSLICPRIADAFYKLHSNWNGVNVVSVAEHSI